MNYPVWQLDFAGGGLLIAIIAVLHVYVSHFAVGGGLFLVLTEMKAYRENSQGILDYTRKHTRFFLLLTMVFGGLTGVGIWFTISVLNPAATSTLIHTFVFGWATEWVFFLGEIVALFIYFHTFGTMERKNHLLIGWLYFIFAWLSLFVINGIIGFMLTPGEWLATGSFWDGFFNPTFWPQLFFRTFLALMLAGLYGFLTATTLKDDALRESLVRYCAIWLLAPFVFFLASAYWYIRVLPANVHEVIFRRSPELLPFIKIFAVVSPVLVLGGLLMAIHIPARIKRSLAAVMLVIGLVYMGAFEWIREGGRRPYVIHGHTFSNSMTREAMAEASRDGLLQTARWVQHRQVDDRNRQAAGRELFNLQCLPCHAIGGPMNDILPLTAKYSIFGLTAKLGDLDGVNGYMPPFSGTMDERAVLASFIVEGLHRKAAEPEIEVEPEPQPAAIPAYDPKKADYVLLAWSDKGMHTISDSDRFFSLRYPASRLNALLIKRGELPEVVTDGVSISYKMEDGFNNPAGQVAFWSQSRSLVGKELPPNTGVTGKALSGTMVFKEEERLFVAEALPVVPYTEAGKFRPYPLVTMEAAAADGKILAMTRVVAPVSTEMGCKNCHGGKWRVAGRTGISDRTARDILQVHDRINKTDLLAKAAGGNPVRCQSCHGDPLKGGESNPGVLNLSAAMHGFHAGFLRGRGGAACLNCHPDAPQGATRFFRGIHKDMGFDCTQCHGTLEDHALGLLKAEQQAGKTAATRLLQHLNLKPGMVEEAADVKPRVPWLQQPDCLTCHVDFAPPETDTAFNVWTAGVDGLYRRRTDDMGIQCAACHNSPHAVYPATNPYGADRDNIVPLQHQKNPYPIGADKNCRLCHTIDMQEEMHHPNSLRMFRNTR